MSQRQLHIISLGCPKTRVDSELILGLARLHGWSLTPTLSEADVVLINTCSFLQSAVEESIDTILEVTSTRSPRCEAVVVSGCLPSRYGVASLREALPEVDVFLTTHDFTSIERLFAGEAQAADLSRVPAAACHVDSGVFEKRALARPQSYAYLKISEGCDRHCAFCMIPTIRGKQVSRTVPSLVREAKALVAGGVKEIILIAQELTHYGADIGLKNGLLTLLDALEDIDGLVWIRLMYAYPWQFGEALIGRLGRGKVLPYVDIPLQHVSQSILKSMRRHVSEQAQRDLLERLREDERVVIRSTVIVGFPGETDADFDALCRWVEEVRFDRLGVFPFSAEEGTVAASLPDPVSEEVKAARYDILMRLQQGIQAQKMRSLVGERLRVLVDGRSEEHEFVFQGRYYGQAPEVDGVVYLSDEFGDYDDFSCGQFVDVEVTDASEYDIVGAVFSP